MFSFCSAIFLILQKYCWVVPMLRRSWQLLLLIPTWSDRHVAGHDRPFELSASVSHKTGRLAVAAQHTHRERGVRHYKAHLDRRWWSERKDGLWGRMGRGGCWSRRGSRVGGGGEGRQEQKSSQLQRSRELNSSQSSTFPWGTETASLGQKVLLLFSLEGYLLL